MEPVVVTKRRPGRGVLADTLRDADTLQQTMSELRGCGLVPRGIYRFESHQEADEWMMRQIAATHARRSSRISLGSVQS